MIIANVTLSYQIDYIDKCCLLEDHRDHSNEQRLIRLSQQNPNYFGELYDMYFNDIYLFVHRRTGDRNVANEIVSNTFLKALENIGKFTYRGIPIVAWLYKIATNEVRRYYRKSKKVLIFSLEEDFVAEMLEDVEVRTINDDALRVLAKALEDLDLATLEIVELKAYENKGFKEIAFIMNLKESAVKMRYYRGLEKVKVVMIDQEKDDETRDTI